MKIGSFIFLFLLNIFITSGQSIRVITNSGFDYIPDTLETAVGDTVRFNAGSSHPTLQVNRETYEANATTALEGGFFFSQGKGELVLEQEDTLYYVCPSHIDKGMKGMILVRTELPTQVRLTTYDNCWEVNRLGDRIFRVKSTVMKPYRIYMYDLSGKCVYQSKTSGVHTIKGQYLKKGLFILRVQSGDKFMIQPILMN